MHSVVSQQLIWLVSWLLCFHVAIGEIQFELKILGKEMSFFDTRALQNPTITEVTQVRPQRLRSDPSEY